MSLDGRTYVIMRGQWIAAANWAAASSWVSEALKVTSFFRNSTETSMTPGLMLRPATSGYNDALSVGG